MKTYYSFCNICLAFIFALVSKCINAEYMQTTRLLPKMVTHVCISLKLLEMEYNSVQYKGEEFC